jgi:hypothetical protein
MCRVERQSGNTPPTNPEVGRLTAQATRGRYWVGGAARWLGRKD